MEQFISTSSFEDDWLPDGICYCGGGKLGTWKPPGLRTTTRKKSSFSWKLDRNYYLVDEQWVEHEDDEDPIEG